MHTILAARTDFSVGESILTVENLINEAVTAKQTAVAITDTMSITAMIDFTTRALKNDLKPIIGVRLRLTDNPTWRPGPGEKKKHMPRSYYVTTYVLTPAGMKAIFRLLTLANSADRFYYEPKLGFSDLDAELVKLGPADLALSLGDERSVLEHPDVATYVEFWNTVCDHVYAPLVAINTPYFGRINELSMDLVRRGLAKPLAIRPALYAKGKADAQEIMTAITENQKITDGWFRSRHNRDLHVMDAEEFRREVLTMGKHMNTRGLTTVGSFVIESIKNTDALVNAVTYTWTKEKPSLPVMAPDEFKELITQCKLGWPQRFGASVFGHQPTETELAEVYKPRLAYELGVLQKLGFSGYFLLVQDIVKFAKSNGILVGPGRGSVGGSLVAYLMGITECDPIRFGLLFERFINPDRLDLPDADLDFMSERRGEIVDYLVKKYGEDRVAGVSNFGTLAAASAIRDVGRVTNIPERDYSVSKMTPKLHGANVPLADCRTAVSDIDAFALKYPEFWEIMESVEGRVRNFSQHAAGMVVAGVDLVERAVVEKRKESAVVCWDKNIVELQGLIKVDILGLRTLDVIALTCDYIREQTGTAPDMSRIHLDDLDVLVEFAEGRTTGIFQYEGGGARRMLKDMGASGEMTFDDVAAVSALNRPGPLEAGLPQIYIDNKSGVGTVSYISPHMEAALAPTYGAIVYQEQVMQISRDLSGFTGAEADVLRKAIGKKDPVLMRKMRDKFVDGAMAGYIVVTLENGSIKKIHAARKFKVLESDEKFTISEILSNDYTLLETL